MQKTALYFPTWTNKIGLQVEVRETLLDEQTEFQRIQVLDTAALGRILLLDGHIQLSELDEHAYHESLVQIPLLSVAEPRRALVVGGGDGGVVRELCRHRSIAHIDMVEIDSGVIEACKETMPFVSDGAFDDPRVHVHIEDAFPFVRNSSESYDFIVVDCTDVYENEDESLSEDLFTRGFYRDLLRMLNDGGMVVTQADNLVFCSNATDAARQKFADVFPASGTYWCIVPSFGSFSGFVWGSKGARPSPTFGGDVEGLRYLDATTYSLAMRPVPFRSRFGR